MKRVALGAVIGGVFDLLIVGVSFKVAAYGVVLGFVITMAIRECRLYKESA